MAKKATKKTARKRAKKTTPKKNQEVELSEKSESSESHSKTDVINVDFKSEEEKRLRDTNGLIKSVDHKFDEFGFVDWKEMIPQEFFCVNAEWFEKFQKDDPVPTKTEGLKDEQTFIRLAGFKHIARLRGIKKVSHAVIRSSSHEAVVVCDIEWIPNFENPEGLSFQAIANANIENTGQLGRVFLESIAENRAFARAVRGSLGVNIVSAEELSTNENSSGATAESSSDTSAISKLRSTTPQAVLEEKCLSIGMDLEALIEKVSELTENGDFKTEADFQSWEKFDDLSPKDARILSKLIKQ